MEEYSHYYKKVPNGVEYIDVYRVLEMFDVTNPSIAHAIKKLLVAGGRGHKDIEKDVKEAIDSLKRWIDMREEEKVVKLNVIGPRGRTDYSTSSCTGANGPAEFRYFGNDN